MTSSASRRPEQSDISREGEAPRKVTEFGRPIKEQEFMIDPEITPLNHGARGAVPRTVRQAQSRYTDEILWRTDNFFYYRCRKMWMETCEEVAKFVKSDPQNLTLVENTTAAINIALKNLPLGAGDGILINNWSYVGVSNTCDAVASKTGAKVCSFNMPLPVTSSQEIVDLYAHYLEAHPEVKVAIIDHICGFVYAVLPVKEILKVCRKHDVITIVDGAHAPGQLPLNLEELGADFYAGNLHKWGFAPMASALLWVSPRFHATTLPLVTSMNYNHPDWRERFVTKGTVDYAPYFAVKDALKFVQDIGGFEAVTAYNSDLMKRGSQHIVEVLGTEEIQLPPEMQPPHMRMIRLPLPPIDESVTVYVAGWTARLNKMGIWASCAHISGQPFLRLCAHIYNTLDDFKRCAIATLNMVADIKEEGDLDGTAGCKQS